MTPESPPALILYVSVSCGPIVLADHLPAGEHPSVGFVASAGGGDLAAIASRCLDAAPRFHLLYTHTACRRIYSFLIAEPLLFFAIADESLGRPAVRLFLHRLRDGASFAACRRIDFDGPIPHCLQDELEPIIRSLALSFSTSLEVEDRPSPSPPPPSSDSLLLTGEHKRKVKKNQKKNARSEEAGGGCEVEISVLDDGGVADRGRKSPQRIWRQQVRMVLVVDLVVCSILFGIWLSVCRGFQCIDS